MVSSTWRCVWRRIAEYLLSSAHLIFLWFRLRKPSISENDSVSKQANVKPNSKIGTGCVIRTHKSMFLAILDEVQANVMAAHELKNNYIVVPVTLTSHTSKGDHETFSMSSLAEIFKFDTEARVLVRQNPGSKIVFCTGTGDRTVQLRAALLFGCHMIMTLGVSLERTWEIFEPIRELLESVHQGPHLRSVHSCWATLATAKGLGWIDFGHVFETGAEDDSLIFLDEFLHYASPLNGEIHIVVPGKVMLFKTPVNGLPDGCGWRDVEGRRQYSPAFFADILPDLGVNLVIRLDDTTYDPSVYTNQGMFVEDLSEETVGDVLNLQVLDRVLRLTECAEGAVAIHCDGRPGCSGTLLVAFMVRNQFFTETAQAVTWLQMIQPHSMVEVEQSLVELQLRPRPWARKAVSFSMRPKSPKKSISPVARLRRGGGGGDRRSRLESSLHDDEADEAPSCYPLIPSPVPDPQPLRSKHCPADQYEQASVAAAAAASATAFAAAAAGACPSQASSCVEGLRRRRSSFTFSEFSSSSPQLLAAAAAEPPFLSPRRCG